MKHTTLSYTATLLVNNKLVSFRRHEQYENDDQANRRIKALLVQNVKHEGEIKYSNFRTDTIHTSTNSL